MASLDLITTWIMLLVFTQLSAYATPLSTITSTNTTFTSAGSGASSSAPPISSSTSSPAVDGVPQLPTIARATIIAIPLALALFIFVISILVYLSRRPTGRTPTVGCWGTVIISIRDAEATTTGMFMRARKLVSDNRLTSTLDHRFSTFGTTNNPYVPSAGPPHGTHATPTSDATYPSRPAPRYLSHSATGTSVGGNSAQGSVTAIELHPQATHSSHYSSEVLAIERV